MMEHGEEKINVDQFLQDKIDTVPHLEALLLLWSSRPKSWTIDEMAKGLYVAPELAKAILEDLARQRLVDVVPGESDTYRYDSEAHKDRIIACVDSTYRRELIRVSRLLHSKPSAAVREFARAFRFKMDPE